ncbi:phosphoadenosine phosphosulfate reductase [Pseudorhodobacter sp. E13]|uniref:phosphoadenosine phosphosulfate reductase n=1 Tax=Pseudorhodobacter sp. E13 TaxID=2487931 RepID=UPI000F8CEA7A|nr:phosphoadenosine phosphosulfate reductase [Pseudorhodobacter sp. E13]
MTDQIETTTQTETPAMMDRAGWLSLLENMGNDSGFFEPLGKSHWAVFNEDGPTLVISFDRLEDIRALEPGKMPHIFGQATQNGWSHLSLISEGDTWYRDKAVYAFLDRLVDESFFDDYDRVVFYGAGMGGYAAAAFSVTAPGCTVLALQPRASLDPEIAGWETRYTASRRLNFTDRYGYAPDMTEGAAEVFTLHDPYNKLDAMHVALFRKSFATHLKARFLGDHLVTALSDMGVLPKLVKAVCDGKLSAPFYNKLWRERRSFGNYLRWILRACAKAGHPKREAMICRSVTNRLRAPGFRSHLEKLEQSGTLDKS